MEALKEAVINMAVCSVVCAAVFALLPKSGGRRALGILAALTMITVIVTPFASQDFSGELSEYYAKSNTDSYYEARRELNEKLLREYEATVEQLAEEALKKCGVADFKVKAEAQGYGEYGINVTAVRIYCKDEYKDRKEEIQNAVSAAVEVVPEIIFEGI